MQQFDTLFCTFTDFRKCKVLDIERACLFEDLTYMTPEVADIYSIEIKPKKAWAPATEREFPECIFCMNQYLKVHIIQF